jgi:hypothetical protein
MTNQISINGIFVESVKSLQGNLVDRIFYKMWLIIWFKINVQGVPDKVIHCICQKIEPLWLLFQLSFVRMETTYYKDKPQKIVWWNSIFKCSEFSQTSVTDVYRGTQVLLRHFVLNFDVEIFGLVLGKFF